MGTTKDLGRFLVNIWLAGMVAAPARVKFVQENKCLVANNAGDRRWYRRLANELEKWVLIPT